MGLTTFSILNLVLSFTVRSERRSVFSLDTFDDRRFDNVDVGRIATNGRAGSDRQQRE